MDFIKKIDLSNKMREYPTKAEAVMRSLLKANFTVPILQQHILVGYIVDFYLPNQNVVIEVDGSSHYGRYDYDSRRDTILSENGLTILHFSNYEVTQKPTEVIRKITKTINPPELPSEEEIRIKKLETQIRQLKKFSQPYI